MKRIRRRNRQVIKAYMLHIPLINIMYKTMSFAAVDNSPLICHLVTYAPSYYYKSFAQYRQAKKIYHFEKYHTKYFPIIV